MSRASLLALFITIATVANSAELLEVDTGLFVHADKRIKLELNSMDRKPILTVLKLCI